MSDYYAIAELHKRDEATSHAVAKDKTEAALLAVLAGINVETPDADCYPNLVQLVQNGKLDESVIDELVAPLLKHKFLLGLFDDPYINADFKNNDSKMEKDRAVALTAAHETITLLKNDTAILPLGLKAQKNKKIAVIGPNADRVLLGGYSGKPKYFTTVLQGIKQKVGSTVEILHSEGCKLTVGGSWNDDPVAFPTHEQNQILIDEAVVTAKRSDMVILVLGGNEQTSREAWNRTHMGDRASLELFGRQNDLTKAIVEIGKPVVVLFFNGRPNSFEYINANVQAILECWYLGQECGHAVADVLFGDYNPSGKLPMSMPRSAGHIPSYYNYKPSARRGYLADDVSPLYHFGYGLSYTSFSFTNLKIEKSSVRLNESTLVTVEVTNTGKRSGSEVVQLYIRDTFSSVTRPVKELKGFKKIFLNPGESKTVGLTISPELLAFTNIDMKFVVEAGEFEIMVGNSSRDADLQKVILTVEK